MSIETDDPLPPERSDDVWPCARPATAPTGDDSRRPVLIRGTILIGVSALFGFALGWLDMGRIVAGVGIVIVTIGAVSIKAFHAIDHALQVFAHWVGQALAWAFLAPVFFVCFVPARLILKLKGADPMQRAFASDAESYWIPYRRAKPEGDCRRQW